jgi:hypothetical protein
MGPPVSAHGSSLGEFKSLAFWRNYADLVAEVVVTGESQPTSEQADGIESYVPRKVRLEVGSVIFERLKDAAPPYVEVIQDGYAVSREKGIRIVVNSSGTFMEVGERYIVGLALTDAEEWGILTPTSVLPVDNATVSLEREKRFSSIQDRTYLQQYEGRSVSNVRADLLAIRPDPLVEQYANYGGYARLQIVDVLKRGEPSIVGSFEALDALISRDVVPTTTTVPASTTPPSSTTTPPSSTTAPPAPASTTALPPTPSSAPSPTSDP